MKTTFRYWENFPVNRSSEHCHNLFKKVLKLPPMRTFKNIQEYFFFSPPLPLFSFTPLTSGRGTDKVISAALSPGMLVNY